MNLNRVPTVRAVTNIVTMITDMHQDLALVRLLQLSSVSLPVGGFAFSQGLEYAVECGWLRKQPDVEQWLSLQLTENIARVDLPILREVMLCSQEKDWTRFTFLNDLILASRETKELRLTDTAMGEALFRLLKSLDFDMPFVEKQQEDISFVCLFAYAAAQWQIPYRSVAMGLSWSWLENQVAAATKLVPLGQTQAQQLLVSFQTMLPKVLDLAETIETHEIGGGLPALAIASALHETQYTRLFRS